MSEVRTLPFSQEAEDALLSSFLIDPQFVGGLCAEQGVQATDFWHAGNAIIYGLLAEMWQHGAQIDNVTLLQALADRGLLEAAGGAARPSELLTKMPTSRMAESYIAIVRDKAILRAIIRVCHEHSARAYADQESPQESVSNLSQAITEIAGAAAKKGALTLKQALMEKIERMQANEADADVLRTGLLKLDSGSPLRRGDMPLISGERKAGKSILALSLATNLALDGRAVLYFSLEDQIPKVIDRLVAGTAKIPPIRQHASRMTEGDWGNATRAVSKLAETRFQIRDDVFDLPAIVAVARQQKVKWPDLALIVVDYAQLVRASMRSQDSREREVATVSRTLRLLAMELDAAILLLAQLNKQGEARESRALEQDATAMWEVRKTDKEEEENTHRMIHVPWQRNGESGVAFQAIFQGHLARFENLMERT